MSLWFECELKVNIFGNNKMKKQKRNNKVKRPSEKFTHINYN